MQDERSVMRKAEKAAGVIAMIAALIVLNGAWVNQHTWQNVSWRIAVAGILAMLAVIVETRLFGLLRPREDEGADVVPEFMRSGGETRFTDRGGVGDAETEVADARVQV
jgi:hypothetical protein